MVAASEVANALALRGDTEGAGKITTVSEAILEITVELEQRALAGEVLLGLETLHSALLSARDLGLEVVQGSDRLSQEEKATWSRRISTVEGLVRLLLDR